MVQNKSKSLAIVAWFLFFGDEVSMLLLLLLLGECKHCIMLMVMLILLLGDTFSTLHFGIALLMPKNWFLWMKLLCFYFATHAFARSNWNWDDVCCRRCWRYYYCYCSSIVHCKQTGKCVIGLIVKINGLLLLHFIEVDVVTNTHSHVFMQGN